MAADLILKLDRRRLSVSNVCELIALLYRLVLIWRRWQFLPLINHGLRMWTIIGMKKCSDGCGQ